MRRLLLVLGFAWTPLFFGPAVDAERRVGSIEIWHFENAGRAQAALDGFAAPDWHFERVGPLLIMTRGLVNEAAGVAHRGVFPDCRSLAARVRERAAARLP